MGGGGVLLGRHGGSPLMGGGVLLGLQIYPPEIQFRRSVGSVGTALIERCLGH